MYIHIQTLVAETTPYVQLAHDELFNTDYYLYFFFLLIQILIQFVPPS